jgi:hypothetical protein
MIFYLFNLIFHGRVSVSSFPYNITFVQRGFAESNAFERHIPRVRGEFIATTSTYIVACCVVVTHRFVVGDVLFFFTYLVNIKQRCPFDTVNNNSFQLNKYSDKCEQDKKYFQQ